MNPNRTNGPDGERAVSPVIGVILMVAITVILAAVIGTFVLNLGSNVQSNVQAGASVSYDDGNNEIKIVFTSNQNADHLNVNTTGAGTSDAEYSLRDVGATLTLKAGASDDSFDSGVVSQNVEFEASDGNSITVTVTAVKGDQSTVIVSKTDTL